MKEKFKWFDEKAAFKFGLQRGGLKMVLPQLGALLRLEFQSL